MQPQPTIYVRPVQASDAELLRFMCWTDRSIDSIIELIRRSEKLATNRRGLAVVAVIDNIICGFGLLTLWPRAAEISDLIVNENYRSCGIGTQIISYLTDAARELKGQTLEIGVALSNPRAVTLYRRLGFEDGRAIELDLGSGPEPVLYLYKSLR